VDFSPNKRAPANRKEEFYANCLLKNEKMKGTFGLSRKEL
jgi:hypothetical protein